MGRVEWNGYEYATRVRAAAVRATVAAGTVVQRQMKMNFGSSGGGVIGHRVKGKFVPKTGPTKRHRGRQVFASSPEGGFPGIRTGTLRRSIAVQSFPGRVAARVGTSLGQAYGGKKRAAGKRITPARYGYLLEFGTTKMAARPWAVRSMRMASNDMKAAFDRSMRSSLAGKK